MVYESGAVSVTGIYNINTPGSSTLQSVSLGMSTPVDHITITPTNGASDCVCLEKFTLVSGLTTTVALDGVGSTTTTTAPNSSNNNQAVPVTGTLTPPSTPGALPTSNAVFNASTIGTTTTRKFDGGKVVIDTTNFSDSHPYTVTSNGGIIDILGHLTTLGGTVSDDAGASGKLYVMNSGSGGKLVLGGTTNTNTGGYSIQPGAIIEIADAGALGTGDLDLVGSSTVPSVLNVTATTTITQHISVSGDPTFNISSGTTTTVSTAITDGGASGEIVVSGGGTLALTATNTYTGGTTISNDGSTLKLVDGGTIANTSGVINNGNFDVRSVTSASTSTVNVNAYTQGSSGNLKLAADAVSVQILNVVGAA